MATTVSQPAESGLPAFPPTHLLSAIVDSSNDAIVSKALDGTVTSWNAAAERIFGYTAAEIVGQSILRIIPPELHRDETRILAQIIRGERIEHHETVRVRRDGTRIDVSLTISPIRDREGKVIGASKIARDITRQRKADAATRLLAAIVDSSDDAIISKDLDGIITSWNRGAQRIFGYTAEETVGRSITMLLPQDRHGEEMDILERLRRGERIDHFRTIRVRKNGERFHASLTISPLRDDHGRVVGASKVGRDVTAEITALERLEQANESLRRADRMKSEFLASMSHELRTPLNSIIGFASVLMQGRSGPVTEDQRRQLRLIHASGTHLLQLINDLLDVSRIEAGRMEVEPEVFSPAEVLQEVARSLEVQLTQKRLALRCAIEATGPVTTDRKRFVQIVLNLLGNAIKFTPRGHVALGARRDGDRLCLTIEDTGVGISEEDRSRLFLAFSQLDPSSRRRYEGTGLGLFLCRKLVTLLGGDISVQSTPGKGSTFTFWIPATYSGERPAAGPVAGSASA